MATTDRLGSSLRHTHDVLAERLEAARARTEDDDAAPRAQRARIDAFLASTSQHLHTVDGVLLPAVRRECEGGHRLVHDFLAAARALEVELCHVKAHEYGSVFESRFGWSRVWAGVEAALAEERRHEQRLAEELERVLDADRLEELRRRFETAEPGAPTRPHPYTPHTGILGLMARRVMHAVDAFWDTAEGRMVPEPQRRRRKEPGLLGQYLLGDPRFDPDEHGPPRAGAS